MDAVIYHPVELARLLSFILNRSQATTTLVVICTGRADFLGHLKLSCQTCDALSPEKGPDVTLEPPHQRLLQGTLRNLAASRTVRLAFCPSLLALQAYLAALPCRGEYRSPHKPAIQGLILINPIALHRSAFGFSAQTLSRTFAMAIETALDLNVKLEVVETQDRPRPNPTVSDVHEDTEMLEGGDQAVESDRVTYNQADSSDTDVWGDAIPVLSSSNKTYGMATDTDWFTRTIKIREVAARHFVFQNLE